MNLVWLVGTMLAVVQRVRRACVEIDGQIHSQIDAGLLVFLGIGQQDTPKQAERLAQKVAQLRIFGEEKMDFSVIDQKGEVLVVSQFTLLADTRRGNRPSFVAAAKPEQAIPLYEFFVKQLSGYVSVKTGVFGADMQVSLLNDGPVTIVLDSGSHV